MEGLKVGGGGGLGNGVGVDNLFHKTSGGTQICNFAYMVFIHDEIGYGRYLM